MATSPTSKSALTSGAADEDTVGLDGDFVFTVKDLLANDPGGAAKVSIEKQFFFGDTADDRLNQVSTCSTTASRRSRARTAARTSSSPAATCWTSTTSSRSATRARGLPPTLTSQTARTLRLRRATTGRSSSRRLSRPTQAPQPRLVGRGQPDNRPATGPSAGHGWAVDQGGGQWGSVTGEIARTDADNSWLDTQNSPGGIDITNWFIDHTGGEFHLSFDLGIRDFGSGSREETDPNATLKVLVDGKEVDPPSATRRCSETRLARRTWLTSTTRSERASPDRPAAHDLLRRHHAAGGRRQLRRVHARQPSRSTTGSSDLTSTDAMKNTTGDLYPR